MAVCKTSLSAGEIIRDVLIKDEEVKTRVNKVFPVVEDKATLPYITYRRVRLEPCAGPSKDGRPRSTACGCEAATSSTARSHGKMTRMFSNYCFK